MAWPRWRSRLWTRHLKHNLAGLRTGPTATVSCCRNGHGSMLLYALLHLTGYDLPMDELQALPPAALARRPATPKSASRPASRPPPARSARASANAVGMALAEKLLAARVQPARPRDRRPPHLRVRRRRLPDGRHQPRGLRAGRRAWKLNKLIALLRRQRHLDRRRRSKPLVSRTTCASAFSGYGWRVLGPIDGHDVDAVDGAHRASQGGCTDAADADHLPHHHRQGRAQRAPAPPRRMASRSAPSEIAPTRAGAGLDRTRRSRCPGRVPRCGTRARRGAARAGARGTSRFGALPGGASRARRRVRSAACRGELPPAFDGMTAQRCRRCGMPRPKPWPRARRSQLRARSVHAALPEAARWFGRPDRLEPDQHRARRRCVSMPKTARPTTAATSTTACASSAWPRS